MGRIHGRTHGCKWSLLKGREGKYKGSMVGTGGILRPRESVSSQIFFVVVFCGSGVESRAYTLNHSTSPFL
jgi:hypothetical protein